MHLGLQPSALPTELHVGVGHLYGLYSAPPLPVPREPVQEVCPALWRPAMTPTGRGAVVGAVGIEPTLCVAHWFYRPVPGPPGHTRGDAGKSTFRLVGQVFMALLDPAHGTSQGSSLPTPSLSRESNPSLAHTKGAFSPESLLRHVAYCVQRVAVTKVGLTGVGTVQ